MKNYFFLVIILFTAMGELFSQSYLSNDYTKAEHLNELTFSESVKYYFSGSGEINIDLPVSHCHRDFDTKSYYFRFEMPESPDFSLNAEFDNSEFFILTIYHNDNGIYHILNCEAFNDKEAQICVRNSNIKAGTGLIGRVSFKEESNTNSINISVSDKLPELIYNKSDLLVTQGEHTIEEFMDIFAAEGEIIDNINYIGHPEAIGYFYNANEIFGFNDGVILSTGIVMYAVGPNISGSTTTNFGTPGDSLLTVIAGNPTYDAAILEFEFTPQADILLFTYVFASEEYPEYVNSSYNDVFAFFISGGPENYEYVNIALLPGTNVPVSINNVSPLTNSQFYINNDSYNFEYDGFTTTMNALASVTEGETYSLRIGIADVGDGAFDSAIFLKSGSLGSDYSISGSVFIDSNNNCIADDEEQMLQNRIIKIEPGPMFTSTNSEGKYYFLLENGNYTISTVIPPLWDNECYENDFYNITLENINDYFDNIDFPITSDYDCPLLYVDIVSGNLRPCMINQYVISYKNEGIPNAENAIIELQLESILNIESSTIPYSNIAPNTYIFEIGDVGAFEQGSIYLDVYLECDMDLVGLTSCATAIISSDNDCIFEEPGIPGGNDTIPPGQNPDWDNSSVSVSGECVDDYMACFTITNTGEFGEGDMETPNEYRIFANDTLVYIGEFQLAGGESIEICWETDGRAIRLEADQSYGHPGFSNPQETIEDCGDFNGTSLGYITTTPFDDMDFNIDIHCMEITAAYDPNDKHVQPSGIGENNYFYDNTAILSYLINFQNTGTDTAFKVIIIDTLSPWLDVTTIQPGPATHPYTFEVSGQGVVKFIFENILLPDSTTNEPESKGFVTFKINQMPLVAPDDYGTVISNKAEIYFDFNEPIVTNYANLTFWKTPEIILHKPDINDNSFEINVFPNPINTKANIKINNYESNYPLEFILFDINGKIVRNISNISQSEFEVGFDLLPAGVYIYKIQTGKEIIGSGRLVLE